MTQVIIYKNESNGVSVIYPTEDALSIYGINKIAIKDVPNGRPYKIIDSSELPDREYRNRWYVDESDLTDGIGGESNEFN